MQKYDLIVIGGGNAYRVAHKTAEELDWKVALVESGPLGGTCPNRGCIPSKKLFAHAQAANRVARARRFHVDAELRGVDADAVLRDVRESTKSVDARMEKGLHDNVELVRGAARFVGEREVEVEGKRLAADRVLIATGARARRPDPDLLGDVDALTSRDVFELERAPSSLAIVGGGLVGAEMATFFAGLGVPVTLLESEAEILKNEDPGLREFALASMDDRVEVKTAVEWKSSEKTDAGVLLRYDLDGEEHQAEAAALLVAMGRVPNTDDLALDRAGVRCDADGYVIVDKTLATTAPGVWALGDVRGGEMYTHTASAEAHYLVQRFQGARDDELDLGPIPHAVFTDPPLASVGLTSEEFESRGIDGVVVRAAYEDVAMGAALRDEHGFCKLVVDRHGAILGAHIAGEEAPTLLHEILPVLRWRNHVATLAELVHVHPALSELVQAAARQAVSELESPALAEARA